MQMKNRLLHVKMLEDLDFNSAKNSPSLIRCPEMHRTVSLLVEKGEREE